MMDQAPSEQYENKARRLGTLVDLDDGADYELVRERWLEARRLLHELMAERIAPAFNRYLASASQDTLEEKQELGRHANEELRHLGLAIKSPKSGAPSMLQGDLGRQRDVGRFRLVPIGSPRTRGSSVSSAELFRLELMQRPERVEPGVDAWRRRTRRDPDSDRSV